MRYSVALLAAAFLCGCASNKYIPVPAADLESEKGAQTVAQFPPISSGQTTYTINSTQTRLNIQNLVLPDNFILDAAPDVKQIRWTVQNVQIGKKVLIDLSAKGVPAKQPTERPARQADYCKWRKKGSENNGLCRCRTRPSVAILTTAGVTFSSIGARLGNSLPSNSCGRTAFTDAEKKEHAASKIVEKNFGTVLIILSVACDIFLY